MNVRLTVSGLEVNLLVKVGLPHVYVRVEERGFQHLLFAFLLYIAVPCGNLSSPVNGLVTVNGSTFGSQANYNCSEGYVLNGNSSRLCQADGQWSGSEPTCEGVPLICLVNFWCIS